MGNRVILILVTRLLRRWASLYRIFLLNDRNCSTPQVLTFSIWKAEDRRISVGLLLFPILRLSRWSQVQRFGFFQRECFQCSLYCRLTFVVLPHFLREADWNMPSKSLKETNMVLGQRSSGMERVRRGPSHLLNYLLLFCCRVLDSSEWWLLCVASNDQVAGPNVSIQGQVNRVPYFFYSYVLSSNAIVGYRMRLLT